MALSISDVNAVLKKVIQPYIRDNVPTQTIILDQMKRNADVQFFNNNFYAPIRTGKNSGIVNLASDNGSTRSGNASWSQASVGVKLLTGAFDITKLVIAATGNDKGAVQNMLTAQSKSMTSDYAKVINRQAYGDGYGVVGMVNATGTTNVAVSYPGTGLSDTRSTEWYGTVNNDISPTKYLAAGQVVGLGSAGARLGTISSLSVNKAAGLGTITFNAATVGTANEPIYIVDGDGSGAGTSEAQGIRLALGTDAAGTYAGIARSVDGWLAQTDSTSEALSLSRMEDVYLSALEYAQEGDTFAIFVNRKLFKKYGDLLTALRRTVNQTELLGGWTGLEFAAGKGKVGVFLDYDVPDGEVVILNFDTWTICQVEDMDWMDGDSPTTMLRIANSIKYQAVMTYFFNFLCTCPAANGRLTRKTG